LKRAVGSLKSITMDLNPQQLEERIEILQNVEFLKGIPVGVLKNLATVLQDVALKKQEIVFRKGDIGESMYIIIEGSVRIHDGDHVLTRMRSGKVFGEYALFDSEKRSASITAEEPTLLFKLNRKDFEELIGSNVYVLRGVLNLVLKRIREMNELERKLAQSYLKIQKQKNEIEEQNRNISFQKKELEDTNMELGKLNDEKHHLINVLAHDLRNPLTSSLCLADLFQSYPQNLSKDQIKSIEVIDSSIRKINTIVNQILDINEIETKNILLKAQPTNLALILKEIVDNYKYALAQKKIRIHEELDELYSIVDENYVTLIFENLLSNAIKFSPENKNIYIKLFEKDNRARIEIIDEGQGISEQDIKKLFGKYQKQVSMSYSDEPNEGIGLSIVKKYVDAQNGKVWCKSEPGKGATLIVEFDIYRT